MLILSISGFLTFLNSTIFMVGYISSNNLFPEPLSSEEEKIFYLSKEIENYFSSVFKQTMYTEFEHYLYNEKLSHTLTSEIFSSKRHNENVTLSPYIYSSINLSMFLLSNFKTLSKFERIFIWKN